MTKSETNVIYNRKPNKKLQTENEATANVLHLDLKSKMKLYYNIEHRKLAYCVVYI